MTRTEYIAQLNKYLRGLSEDEKMDILQYYGEMFDEAGVSERCRFLKIVRIQRKSPWIF